jgi:hypothetical protein
MAERERDRSEQRFARDASGSRITEQAARQRSCGRRTRAISEQNIAPRAIAMRLESPLCGENTR